MPPTEQCPLGVQNKTNIENLDGELDEFKKDMKVYMQHMDDYVGKLTNHYSQRPSWAIALLITALVGLCVYLAQYAITHQGKKHEPFSNSQQIKTTEKAGPSEAYGSS